MKNLNNPIRNRTCSAVPQPTVPLHTLIKFVQYLNNWALKLLVIRSMLTLVLDRCVLGADICNIIFLVQQYWIYNWKKTMIDARSCCVMVGDQCTALTSTCTTTWVMWMNVYVKSMGKTSNSRTCSVQNISHKAHVSQSITGYVHLKLLLYNL